LAMRCSIAGSTLVMPCIWGLPVMFAFVNGPRFMGVFSVFMPRPSADPTRPGPFCPICFAC
jgi:hypothetical protein